MIGFRNFKIFRLFLALLVLTVQGNVKAQDLSKASYGRDTSFTVNSAYMKIRTEFPQVQIVRSCQADSVKEYLNITYAAVSGRELHADIFTHGSDKAIKHTGIIVIHGGGWSSGTKEMERPLALKLASLSFNVYVLEYRLSPEAPYPAALQDINAAVRWVKSSAEVYGTDTSKIVLLGMSSGAHLAALAGTGYNFSKYQSEYGQRGYSPEVSAIVNIDGVLDLTDPAESGKDSDPEKPSAAKRWLKFSYKDNPELWKEASPINHISEKTPPIVFINSSIERFHAGRDEMIGKMKQYGICSEVHTIENSPHTFWLFNPWFDKTYPLISEFLNSYKDKLPVIDTSLFRDGAHHWYDIDDPEKIIKPGENRKKYRAAEIVKIADNILLYQKSNGGWPKNYDMQAVLSDSEKEVLRKAKSCRCTTFDNGATHSQISYLARVYAVTGKKEYKEAILKGLEFIIKAQYENGGWPQYFPDKSGYRKYITFNDGVMIGIMKVLSEINSDKNMYLFLDPVLRLKITEAYRKGIECILKCQIKENGVLLAWGQQHDCVRLLPLDARAFEPAAICNGESSEIVAFLMGIKDPSREITRSVDAAVEWFDRSRIKGIRVKTIISDEVKYDLYSTNKDRITVADTLAPDIWARYYELGTHRPLFCNRDGRTVCRLEDVERERRVGYAWYVYSPAEIISNYKVWKNKTTGN